MNRRDTLQLSKAYIHERISAAADFGFAYASQGEQAFHFALNAEV